MTQLNTKFQAVQASNLGGALMRIDGRAFLPHVFRNYSEAAEFLQDASDSKVNLFIGMDSESMSELVRLWEVARRRKTPDVLNAAIAPTPNAQNPTPMVNLKDAARQPMTPIPSRGSSYPTDPRLTGCRS